MEYTKLARTGLEVSRICLCCRFRGMFGVTVWLMSDEELTRLEVLRAGIGDDATAAGVFTEAP